MGILIDGYNLLKTCGFVGSQVGPGTLERARGLFVGLLVQALDETQRRGTVVVFDSSLRVPDLPDEYSQQGIRVLFASGHQDADEMIIEMIQQDSSPKQLVVVSSDHQIQQAASRRKATFMDSDQWYERLISGSQEKPDVQLSAQQLKTELTLEKKAGGQVLDAVETQQWLAQFAVATPPSPPAPVDSPSGSGGDAASPQSEGKKTAVPKAVPKTGSRFSQTSLDQLAQIAKTQPDPERDSESATRTQQNSKVPIADPAVDDRKLTRSVELDDISIDQRDIPQLDFDQSMQQSQLKHSMLVPEDLDQWLDDFDSQFLDAAMDGAAAPQRSSGKSAASPQRRRSPAVPEPRAAKKQSPPVDSPRPAKTQSKDTQPMSQSEASPSIGKPTIEPTQPDTAPAKSARPSDKLDIDQRQLDRWNRQLKETDDQIFPPGYGEDLLFAETFERDERLKRKRRQ